MRLKKIISSVWVWLESLFNEKRPDMNKKLAHEYAEKKLQEIISSERERIMNIFKEADHIFLGKDGEEYIYGDIEREGKDGRPTYLKREGRKATFWTPDDGFSYHCTLTSFYDGKTEKIIRVCVEVDNGEDITRSYPICRDELLNSHDLSIYEKPSL